MIEEIVLWGIVIAYLGITGYYLRKTKIDVYSICMIGVFTAIAIILRCIRMPLPTGTSIALLSVLPTMILSLLKGARIGIISGLLTGLIGMFIIPGYAPIHPLQIFVEQMSALSVVGYAGIMGIEHKTKMVMACSGAIIFNVMFHIFSGVLFFGQFAPAGQGVWEYSIIYNVSSHGVEGLISIIVLTMLPLKNLKRMVGGKVECHL